MPVEFGDLPPATRKRRGGGWMQEAKELRANVGRWALVAKKERLSQSYGLAGNIRNGAIPAFRPIGTFEATCRGTEVWARYVGDGADVS